MADPLISVRDLRYTYDDGTVALSGVDFDLYPEETVALLGANGSGKTTFVLHLNGLLASNSGVTVCGLPVTSANLPEIRRRVGVVFQESDEQLFMPTVLEDVMFGPMNLGMDRTTAEQAARSALEKTGMLPVLQKAPYHLSAGEKKRVAIAGVIAMSPDVLILDEPTTYLDPPGQRQLILLLRTLRQAKIVVTHDVNFARAVADRAVFFEKGRIAAHGTVDQIIGRFDWTAEPSKSEIPQQ